MRKLLILAIGITMPFFAYSQLSSFDLSSYKLPDILTRKLDFQFDLDGYQNFFQDISDRDNPSKRDDFRINTNYNMAYSQFRNSEKYQGFKEFDVNVLSNYHGRKNDQDTLRSDYTLKLVFSLQNHNRWYKENNRFFELDYYVQPGFKYNFHSNQEEKINRHQKYVDSNFDIWLLWGTGRIDPIEDARLAIYILEDLHRIGYLKRTPNQKEIISIAETVSKIKRKRSFDHRLHKIDELHAMDSILKDMGLVKGNEIGYFTSLVDNWDYSNGPSRSTGRRVSGGIHFWKPGNSYQINGLNNQKFLNTFFGMIFGPMLRCSWEKPLNLYWQRSVSVASTYYFGSTELLFDAIKNKREPLFSSFNSKIDFAMGYYPNSRTSVRFTSGLEFSFQGLPKIEKVFTEMKQYCRVIPRIGVVTEYYLSPELRLNLNYSIYSYHFKSDEYDYNINDYKMTRKNSLHQNFSATFLYSIF